MDKLFLQSTQKIAYNIWLNSSKSNKLSQVYLLSGPKTAPVLDVAKYFAKSLQCSEDYFACNECLSCMRFDSENCPDYLLLDCKDGSIKKDDIRFLEDRYSYGELEKGHKLVYIINNLENLRSDAVSVLLKFLEEPPTDVIGILTTNNIERVLKTIVSRSLVIPIAATPIIQLIDETKNEIGENLSYVVAHLSSNKDDCLNLAQDESFVASFNAANEFLLTWCKNGLDQAIIVLLNDIVNELKSKICYNYFYEILNIFFIDGINNSTLIPSIYVNYIDIVKNNRKKLIDCVSILNQAITLSIYNLNFFLTLSKITKVLKGDKK